MTPKLNVTIETAVYMNEVRKTEVFKINFFLYSNTGVEDPRPCWSPLTNNFFYG